MGAARRRRRCPRPPPLLPVAPRTRPRLLPKRRPPGPASGASLTPLKKQMPIHRQNAKGGRKRNPQQQRQQNQRARDLLHPQHPKKTRILGASLHQQLQRRNRVAVPRTGWPGPQLPTKSSSPTSLLTSKRSPSASVARSEGSFAPARCARLTSRKPTGTSRGHCTVDSYLVY